MPGFLNSSTALAVFQLKKPELITLNKLKQHAFMPIDKTGEAKGWGWTSLEDMSDTHWERSIPEKGHFMVFALRADTRKVAAPVLKKHLQEAFRLEEEKNKAEGKSFISRARKKEIKELHTSKLLAKTEPVPSTTDIAVDLSKGLVYMASSSKSVLSLVQEHMTLSFGETPEPLQAVLAQEHGKTGEEQALASQLMREIYDGEQSVGFDGHKYTVSGAGQVSLAGISGDGAGIEVTSKNDLDSAQAGLEAGLKVSKLKMRLEGMDLPDSWTFTWNTDGAFSGLKTPQVEANADDNSDDPESIDAKILEKLYLISQAAGVMSELFKTKLAS